MVDWSSYDLSDFLLFSAETYFRLIAQYNSDVRPAHVVAVAAGLYLLWGVIRPTPLRYHGALMVLGWAWLAATVLFVWQRYATINWAAAYLVPVMVVQGGLLFVLAVSKAPLVRVQTCFAGRAIAITLLTASVVLYPLFTSWAGSSLAHAEVFGVMPDPTAAATLAVLALTQTRWAVALMFVPLLWCLVSALTLWTLGTPMFAAPLVLAVLGVAARVILSSGQRGQTGS